MAKTVPRDYRVKPGAWGESKLRVQIMLTPTALAKVDEVADELRLTRAEVLERLVRTSSMNANTLKSVEAVDASKGDEASDRPLTPGGTP